jgi:flagellar biosynthesis/type III secretory pathway protein FliH
MHWGLDGYGEPAQESFRPSRDPAAERESRHIQSLLTELVAAVEELEQRRAHSLSELQQLAIDLAVTVASAVAETAISREEHGVEALVEQAIKRMGVGGPLEIAVSPRDAALLQSRISAGGVAWPAEAVQLVEDSALEPGSVRITRDGTGLLSRVQSRLSDIRRHLIEGLDDAQIERRNAPGTDSLLRRFPNRRSSA